MPTSARLRLPISTRHAFALAFDLAARRDPLHSLIVPLLLRAPWALAVALLPPPEQSESQPQVMLITSMAVVGDFIMMLVVGAMLRVRARSVFNTPVGARPAPAGECYALGLRRIPWLLVTEVVRNTSLALATSFSILPAVFIRLRLEDLTRNLLLLVVAVCMALPTLFLGFRLAVATEAVVLREHDLAGAFQRSFRMMRGCFERWLELITLSGVLVLGLALLCAAFSVGLPAFSGPVGIATFWLLVIAVTPVIQYAWTFFYLLLVEIDEPVAEVGPTYAAAAMESRTAAGNGTPRLELVPRVDRGEPDRDTSA